MTQDEYDDLLVDEHYEKKGRFASGPDDDPWAKREPEKPRFTVYECDRAGVPWDLCQTDDPALALKSLTAGRLARPSHAVGVYETDEPEQGDCETLLEELTAEAEIDIRFCDDCGREVMGDFCSACREHERRRDDPVRAVEEATIQRLNKTNFPS